MTDYVFVNTKLSWILGSFYNSLSFSSDGTTLAGTTALGSAGYPNGKVQFWDTANGTPTWSANDWSFVTFSPTDPDIFAVIGSQGMQLMKWDSPGGKTWNYVISNNPNLIPGRSPTACFRYDGKFITTSLDKIDLWELDANQVGTGSRFFNKDGICSFVYRPLDFDMIVVGYDTGEVEVRSYVGPNDATLLSSPSQTGSARVSVCAWSQDRNWIATGDDVGVVRLWNAGVTTNVSLANTLPAVNSTPILSLIFVPDSRAFIILSALHLAVWDIAKGQYVSNSGLPTTAKGIALDGPRNRLAVVVDDRVTLFERKLRTQQPIPPPQQTIPPRKTIPPPQQNIPPRQTIPPPQRTIPPQKTIPPQRTILPQQTIPPQQTQGEENAHRPS